MLRSASCPARIQTAESNKADLKCRPHTLAVEMSPDSMSPKSYEKLGRLHWKVQAEPYDTPAAHVRLSQLGCKLYIMVHVWELLFHAFVGMLGDSVGLSPSSQLLWCCC